MLLFEICCTFYFLKLCNVYGFLGVTVKCFANLLLYLLEIMFVNNVCNETSWNRMVQVNVMLILPSISIYSATVTI